MFLRLPMMMKLYHLRGPITKGPLVKDSQVMTVEKSPKLVNARRYSDDADKENKEKNEDEVEMPGFNIPYTMKPDNFFASLTKEQIEEIKEKYKSGARDNN